MQVLTAVRAFSRRPNSACPPRARKAIATLIHTEGTQSVNQLIAYLLQNLQLDFQGEITMDSVRQFLRDDDSREARKLLGKLIEDQGVDDMLITLADCLKDHLRGGINEQVVGEQLRMYSDS